MRFFKRLLAGVAVAVSVLALPGVVHAQEVAPAAESHSVTFSQPVWTVLTAVALPVAIGLLLKVSASPRVKVIVAIVVTVATALVERAVLLPDGSAVLTRTAFIDVMVLVVSSQTAYKLWDKSSDAAELAPKLGLG